MKNKKTEQNLILNKITLNQMIQSDSFSTKAEPVFLVMMKLLFGTKTLNLRNNIAHAGLEYQNYYHVSAAAMLYLILTAVVNDYWKK